LESTAIVVDELALVRAGIEAGLTLRGIEVTASTRSAREAVSAAVLDRPGLVVCGTPADLPVADAARRLLGVRPAPVVVVLLAPAHDHLVPYLVALGAGGVGLRAGEVGELGDLVERAAKGERVVAPALQAALQGGVRLPPLGVPTADLLTSREREVLVLLSEGRTNRDIAATLSVTLATVKSHLVRIYAKLEAGNRNEALGRAVSLGLLR
jgi:DNA-binding NarL/FixJ family response regulator